jgi:hypothetical protein
MEAVDASTVSALGLSFTLFLGVIMFILPRRYAPIPMLIIGAYMTYGQILNIAGFHFMMMRVMILIGWLRLLIRGEFKGLQLNKLDIIILFWLIAHFSIYVLREQTTDALVYELGFAYNALGLYFLFRCLIRDFDDYELIVKSLAIVIIPLAGLMLFELTTGRNVFSLFGGVPEYTLMRDDRLRCQGPFRHPILAGTFGATLFPLFVSLYFKKGMKYLAIAALLAAVAVVGASASSGPLLALIGAVVAMAMWPLRQWMRQIRWGIVIALVALHFIMKAPVWYLLDRISAITGGTGWHRAYLIEQAVNNINEWWLYGMSISNTAEWFAYFISFASDQADITNQYVSEGLAGGILTLGLFIGILVVCFKIIGISVKSKEEDNPYNKVAIWALGASLFAHMLSYISVTYFDQMVLFWYLLLAIISLNVTHVGSRNLPAWKITKQARVA